MICSLFMVIHPISIRIFGIPKWMTTIPPVVHPRPGREISDLDISVRPVGRSSKSLPLRFKHPKSRQTLATSNVNYRYIDGIHMDLGKL